MLAMSAMFAAGTVPAIKLNNGVDMPRVAISLPKSQPEATANIKLAYETGITHFVTANDYLNQAVVGAGLRALNVPRDKYFVTTMTSPCQCSQAAPHCDRNITDLAKCGEVTKSEVLSDIEQLNLSYVDLLLLHGPNEAAAHVGPCGPETCAANRAQWQAYTDMLRAGKTRAIGVGNFCPSCFDCLLTDANTLVPAVNQMQYHVAYGTDPSNFVSYFKQKGVVPHVYEPLAGGALASNVQCESIGQLRNKTAAQVAMRWITQNPLSEMAILTSSQSQVHLQQDTDVFGWSLADDEMAALNSISCATNPELCTHYDGRLTWGCTS